MQQIQTGVRTPRKGMVNMFYRQEITFKAEELIDYLRKSQSDDPLLTVEEVLEKHEKILDEWALKVIGEKVPEKNKFREVVSGDTIKERPEINKVLRLIESPKYKAVKVVDLPRLTRGDLEDIGRLMKLFKLTDTKIITPERIYDLRDEYDWNAVEQELKRGNDYLKYTKKILNRGRLVSVSQGNYLGTVPPYGYSKTKVKEGKKDCPTLKINEEEAPVVRMIFDMYVNKNMGRASIGNVLNDMGIRTRNGRPWNEQTIKGILENDHYIGKVRWNWRKTIEKVEDGEILITRPKTKVGEYLIFDGRHEAIVSEEIFMAAREKQGRNHRAKPTTKVRNPLASLLFCRCGYSMVFRYSNRSNGIEKTPPRLHCTNQKFCKTRSIYYHELIERVCDVLEQCIEDFEIRIENNEGDSVKLQQGLVNSLQAKLKNLEAKELAQWEAQANPDESQRMPAHIFKQLNEQLLKDKQETFEALCKARDAMPEPVDYEVQVKRFRDALEALRSPDADAEKANALLKQCIEKIVYTREPAERSKGGDKSKGSWTDTPWELDVSLRV